MYRCCSQWYMCAIFKKGSKHDADNFGQGLRLSFPSYSCPSSYVIVVVHRVVIAVLLIFYFLLFLFLVIVC